jgi:hypothetical protein
MVTVKAVESAKMEVDQVKQDNLGPEGWSKCPASGLPQDCMR